MGNTVFIKIRVCNKPLKTRMETIQKLEPLQTAEDCKSLAGVVNYLNVFVQIFRSS